MNKEMYLKILKTHVAETVDFMPYPDEEIVFQHDNDPKHTAKVVKNWLGEQSFTVMDHPPQSPDVNPIENLRSYLKVRLAKDFDSPPSNLMHFGSVCSKRDIIFQMDIVKSLQKACQGELQQSVRLSSCGPSTKDTKTNADQSGAKLDQYIFQ
ncbi:hypothetical protein M8J77_000164 [Diaphorina citri]|nr:hypothetical protein M8J77_000164 [Diaphorina citri]